MLIFFANVRGFLIVIGSLTIGYSVGGWTTGEWDGETAANLLIGGSLAFLVDSVLRTRAPDASLARRLFHPSNGGYLAIVPIWIVGLIWVTLGAVDFATGQGKVRASHDQFLGDSIKLFSETVEALKTVKTPEDEQKAEALVRQSERRSVELADFFEQISRAEKKRINRKFGEKIDDLIDQIRLRSTK